MVDFDPNPEHVADHYHPNPFHLKKLQEGVEAWNLWRKQNPNVWPTLRGVDLSQCCLSYANLANVDFAKANLCQSDLSQAKIYQAEFFSANLQNADLSGADLRGAKFHDANLRNAKLCGADLFRADFIGTDLADADFSEARCWLTAFSNVRLSNVNGLSDVLHSGPSNIDTSTLYNSRKALPTTFLRDAGVPDNLIRELPTLFSSIDSVHFYSCFISYSHKDEEFAKRLYDRMQEAGLRVWFAPENMKAGEKIYDQISEAILRHDKLLLVLSSNSMKSSWVVREIYKARQEEIRSGRRILFPIRLVPFEEIEQWKCIDVTGKDLAPDIREYFIPDFSNWTEDGDFNLAFEQIIEALRANGHIKGSVK